MVSPIGKEPIYRPFKIENEELKKFAKDFAPSIQAFYENVKTFSENPSLRDNPSFLQTFANTILALYPLALKARSLPGE